MPRDFAKSSTSKTSTKRSAVKPKRRKSNKVSPTPRVLFHGPSFSFGVVIGAALIAIAAYLPEITNLMEVEKTSTEATNAAPVATEQPQVTYSFPQMLKDSQVQADPKQYPIPKTDKVAEDLTYIIQAASFRHPDDADSLRAKLIFQDLPAQTATGSSNGERWYRVMVGPFTRKVEAERALTKLREQQLSALLLTQD